MVMNFENGTIYRNCGPVRRHTQGGVGEMGLVMAPGGGGRELVEEAFPVGASGDYQWEAFHRAVNGEPLEGVVTPEQVVAGLRILEAMRSAHLGNGVADVKPIE
jgi:predicted dehydrogenase